MKNRDQSTLEFGYIDEDLDQSSEDSVSIRLGSSSMSSLRISDNPQAEVHVFSFAVHIF